MHSDDATRVDLFRAYLQQILQLLNWLHALPATNMRIVMSPRENSDTPLSVWLRQATVAQRERCACLAGTSVSYLYALAGGHRQQISARLALNIEDATTRIARDTRGRLPVVTARELAFMHDLAGL